LVSSFFFFFTRKVSLPPFSPAGSFPPYPIHKKTCAPLVVRCLLFLKFVALLSLSPVFLPLILTVSIREPPFLFAWSTLPFSSSLQQTRPFLFSFPSSRYNSLQVKTPTISGPSPPCTRVITLFSSSLKQNLSSPLCCVSLYPPYAVLTWMNLFLKKNDAFLPRRVGPYLFFFQLY